MLRFTECLIPTIVEGRDSPVFQPAEGDSKVGYTRDLRDNSARCPEWVHGAIPLREVDSMDLVVPGGSRVPNEGFPEKGYLEEKLK